MIHQRFCNFAFVFLINGTSGLLFFAIALLNYKIQLLSYRLRTCGHPKSTFEENSENDYVTMRNLVKMHIEIKRLDMILIKSNMN